MNRRDFLVGALMVAGVLTPEIAFGEGRGMEGDIPRRYLLPTWYTGRLLPRVEGDRASVKARLQVNLLPMRKARVAIEAGDGLELVSSRVTAAPGSKIGAGSFEGDLTAGQFCELEATVARKPGAGHGFVILAFEYDFPTDETLAHITEHRKDLYPEDELRRLLQKAVVESHRGRKSAGITERVEFGSGGVQ